MKKGPTGRWIWWDALTLFIGMVILAKNYFIYKVVCGLKAHIFDYSHYGDAPFFMTATNTNGLSKEARRLRYKGMLMYYSIGGDKDPEVLKLLGPELAERVRLVALPYASILDYVRKRLILPPSRISEFVIPSKGKIPITANVCFAIGDKYYVLYDPDSVYSKFYLLHELGHVKDNLENGEWAANKFALDILGENYDELKDLDGCTNDLITWCEHISGVKASKFEKKILTDCAFINTYRPIECYKKYVETKDVDYLKEAEDLI